MNPQPRPILTLNAYDETTARRMDDATRSLLERRRRNFGAASVLFYQEPITIARAEGSWIYAADGRRYLDLYNNVPAVGHSHSLVTEAMAAQAALVSVSTRYLHEILEQYAERLLATFPAPLSNVVLTCTGTEANDLALRITRAATGGSGFVVTESAYHGNTAAVTDISPSVARGGPPLAHIRTVPAPGPRAYGDAVAEGLAAAIRGAAGSLEASAIKFAGFIGDSIFSSDGVFADPPGFLQTAVATVHAAGGLFIADEVQSGFARTGDAMWGFQRHGIEPDVVTMGKPMGNGYPMAGLVTRPELLSTFCAEVGYFNTFGGNPVAAAAGLAVLDVIRDEGLQENALRTGAYLRQRLRELAKRSSQIAEVRGAGLFVGVEIARDRTPDRAEVTRLINGLRDRGVLIGAAGRYANVLKIRPPLCITASEVDIFIAALEDALAGE
jgi:4-aminobutyrate aminotransferase-like enzyme